MAQTQTYLSEAVIGGVIMIVDAPDATNLHDPGSRAMEVLAATTSPVLVTRVQAVLNGQATWASNVEAIRLWLHDGPSGIKYLLGAVFAMSFTPPYPEHVPVFEFKVSPFILPPGWAIYATISLWTLPMKDNWSILAFGRKTVGLEVRYARSGQIGCVNITRNVPAQDYKWPVSWPYRVENGMYPLVTAGTKTVKVDEIKVYRAGSGLANDLAALTWNGLRFALNNGNDQFYAYNELVTLWALDTDQATSGLRTYNIVTPDLILPPGWVLYVGKWKVLGALPNAAEHFHIEAQGSIYE